MKHKKLFILHTVQVVIMVEVELKYDNFIYMKIE